MKSRLARPCDQRRPAPRLILKLYGIGIATALVIAGSWFAAHRLIRTRWPGATAINLEIMHDVPELWGRPELRMKLDRVERLMGVTIYDPRGGLVATNVRPPFPAPTPDEQLQAAAGPVPRSGGAVVSRVARGGELLGFLVMTPAFLAPPLRGVLMDLVIISSWICIVGLLFWRTLARPLHRIGVAAEAFGAGNMAARTGVDRQDEIGRVARAFDEMCERVARSREAERELLASVSHELRTPLARIRVALDLAEESDAETVRASLADVAEDLTELETLMSNIFSTTRLEMAAAAREGQPVPLQRTEVDLPALVERAVAHQRAQHPLRTYTVDLGSASAASLVVHADAVLVRRAIENVLDNAHKYSPAGAPVLVDVAREAGAFRVAITDHGFGIDPSDLPRVFTPFFRADRSRTRATGGVGLGLALAKRVIEAHGGNIAVSSEPGTGTTVTFSLPVPGRAPSRPAS